MESIQYAFLVNEIAARVKRHRLTITTAESVTAGCVGTALARGDEASDWLCGALVTYRTETKRRLLNVTADAVVTAECAQQMASGARALTGSDIAVAITGVGGPDPHEGKPAGTVIICVDDGSSTRLCEHHFDGTPSDVVELATRAALRALLNALPRATPPSAAHALRAPSPVSAKRAPTRQRVG